MRLLSGKSGNYINSYRARERKVLRSDAQISPVTLSVLRLPGDAAINVIRSPAVRSHPYRADALALRAEVKVSFFTLRIGPQIGPGQGVTSGE